MNLTFFSDFVHWVVSNPTTAIPQVLAALALLREALRHLEGLFVIWIPLTPESVFWDVWAKMMASFDFLSASMPRKPHAIRALYEWDKDRKRRTAPFPPVKENDDENP